MLVNIDAQDITALSQQFGSLVSSLVEAVSMPAVALEVDVTPAGNFRGFDDTQFYVVREGSLTARYQGKIIYTLEAGDILLPDIAGSLDQSIAVLYGSDSGAQLLRYPALDFMQRVFNEPTAIRLWTRLLITYAGLMLRITAAHTQQGTPVTRIADGEIFGAMTVLTDSDRSATVKAKTVCSVVKVPKEQFTELIKSNPATIHSLLVDMANSIVNLNEQLVAFQGHDHGTRQVKLGR